MPDPTTPARRPDFQQRLLAIWKDPRVRRLALARARDPEVAQDALQESYYAVARVGNPDRIEDLRAYFCRVLLHEIARLLGRHGELPVDNIDGLADARQCRAGGEPLPSRFEETVCSDLQTDILLGRLAAQREALTRTIPARSADPGRYQDVIVAIAGLVLASIARRDVSDADSDPGLTAAYPEWFAEPGLATGNAYQRFSRARADVRTVLRTIISHDDLFP